MKFIFFFLVYLPFLSRYLSKFIDRCPPQVIVTFPSRINKTIVFSKEGDQYEDQTGKDYMLIYTDDIDGAGLWAFQKNNAYQIAALSGTDKKECPQDVKDWYECPEDKEKCTKFGDFGGGRVLDNFKVVEAEQTGTILNPEESTEAATPSTPNSRIGVRVGPQDSTKTIIASIPKVNNTNGSFGSENFCSAIRGDSVSDVICFGGLSLIILVVIALLACIYKLCNLQPKVTRGSFIQSFRIRSRKGTNKFPNVPVTFALKAVNNVIDIDEFSSLLSNLDEMVETEFDQVTKASERISADFTTGYKRENKSRNRDSNILPYEHNRVLIKNGRTNNDYVNASWIKDVSVVMQPLIVASGPTSQQPDSLCLFWDMIIDNQIKTIIMLVNYWDTETNEELCQEYLPNSDPDSRSSGELVVKGAITIKQLRPADLYSQFLVRDFEVERNDWKGNVRHIHVTTWPDYEANKTTDFIDTVEDSWKAIESHGGVLVHDDLGVGRSGVWLATSSILKQIKKGQVDVPGTVIALRRDRMNMVPTVTEYRFLYQVIKDKLTSREN